MYNKTSNLWCRSELKSHRAKFARSPHGFIHSHFSPPPSAPLQSFSQTTGKNPASTFLLWFLLQPPLPQTSALTRQSSPLYLHRDTAQGTENYDSNVILKQQRRQQQNHRRRAATLLPKPFWNLRGINRARTRLTKQPPIRRRQRAAGIYMRKVIL